MHWWLSVICAISFCTEVGGHCYFLCLVTNLHIFALLWGFISSWFLDNFIFYWFLDDFHYWITVNWLVNNRLDADYLRWDSLKNLWFNLYKFSFYGLCINWFYIYLFYIDWFGDRLGIDGICADWFCINRYRFCYDRFGADRFYRSLCWDFHDSWGYHFW